MILLKMAWGTNLMSNTLSEQDLNPFLRSSHKYPYRSPHQVTLIQDRRTPEFSGETPTPDFTDPLLANQRDLSQFIHKGDLWVIWGAWHAGTQQHKEIAKTSVKQCLNFNAKVDVTYYCIYAIPNACLSWP